MTDKHKVNLLSLSPDKEEKERIAEYVKIKKNLNKIIRSLMGMGKVLDPKDWTL
jgi:hypothetical protein